MVRTGTSPPPQLPGRGPGDGLPAARLGHVAPRPGVQPGERRDPVPPHPGGGEGARTGVGPCLRAKSHDPGRAGDRRRDPAHRPGGPACADRVRRRRGAGLPPRLAGAALAGGGGEDRFRIVLTEEDATAAAVRAWPASSPPARCRRWRREPAPGRPPPPRATPAWRPCSRRRRATPPASPSWDSGRTRSASPGPTSSPAPAAPPGRSWTGVRPGDRVAIVLRTEPAFLDALRRPARGCRAGAALPPVRLGAWTSTSRRPPACCGSAGPRLVTSGSVARVIGRAVAAAGPGLDLGVVDAAGLIRGRRPRYRGGRRPGAGPVLSVPRWTRSRWPSPTGAWPRRSRRSSR